MKEINVLNADFEILSKQMDALITDETEFISVLSNTSAFLTAIFDKINWAGFYLLKNNELILGPFQGKLACTKIKIGRGVCGTAVSTKETQLVANVHEFDGHIACDSASNSEIVCPIFSNGEVIGVLDIDSPEFNRFSEEEKQICEMVASKLGEFSLKHPIKF